MHPLLNYLKPCFYCTQKNDSSDNKGKSIHFRIAVAKVEQGWHIAGRTLWGILSLQFQCLSLLIPIST